MALQYLLRQQSKGKDGDKKKEKSSTKLDQMSEEQRLHFIR